MSAPVLRRVCAGSYETTDGAYEVRKVPAGEPEAGRWVWTRLSWTTSARIQTGSGATKAECVESLAGHLSERKAETARAIDIFKRAHNGRGPH